MVPFFIKEAKYYLMGERVYTGHVLHYRRCVVLSRNPSSPLRQPDLSAPTTTKLHLHDAF